MICKYLLKRAKVLFVMGDKESNLFDIKGIEIGLFENKFFFIYFNLNLLINKSINDKLLLKNLNALLINYNKNLINKIQF